MKEDPSFWWNWFVNFAVAVGTIAAALVALFGQQIRGRLFAPKLSMSILSPDGESTQVSLQWVEDGEPRVRWEDARYYHVRVANNRRWSPATQLHVLLLRIEEFGAGGDLRVTWSGAAPLRWRHQEVFPVMRTIGPPADVDLCSVVKGKWLQLHPLIVPFNLQPQRREPTKLILTLQARANEADSPVLRVKIAWDGEWHDGTQEMRGHLSLQLVT